MLSTQIISANRTKYNGVDLFKFLCAIMVFVIHISPFQGEVSGWREQVNFLLKHYICRLAVPFYFVSSGFFLFRKMPSDHLDTDAIKNYCFKILRLLGIWYVLLFAGTKTHLWYLPATVTAVIVVSLFFHFRIRFRYICLLAVLLYIIGLLHFYNYGILDFITTIPIFNYIVKTYDFAFQTTRNGVFMGTIFVLMGAAFARYKIYIAPWKSLIGLAVSMACALVEFFLLVQNIPPSSHDIPHSYDMYLFLLPATFFLFSFATAIQLKDCSLYKHLRNIGILIYFTHMFVHEFVWIAIYALDKYLHINLIACSFIFYLSATLMLAILIEYFSCKKKFYWLNWLVS